MGITQEDVNAVWWFSSTLALLSSLVVFFVTHVNFSLRGQVYIDSSFGRSHTVVLQNLAIALVGLSASFLYIPDTPNGVSCQVQANVVQLFFLVALVYNAAISWETKIEIDRIFLGGKANTPTKHNLRMRMYFVSAFVLVCISLGYINITGDVGYLNSDKIEARFCSIVGLESNLVLTLVPFAASCLVSIYCNFKSLGVLSELLRQSEMDVRISAESKCILLRFIIMPIWPLLIYLPSGIIYFKGKVFDDGNSWASFGIAEALLFPSAGTIVAIIFVFTDCKRMQSFCKRLRVGWLGSENTDRTSNSLLSQSLLDRGSEWEINVGDIGPADNINGATSISSSNRRETSINVEKA